jgi:protein-S-isoprenylcysteine O-methyltransferase Ste14
MSVMASIFGVGVPVGVAVLIGWAGWPPLVGWHWGFIVAIAAIAGLETFASGAAGASTRSGGQPGAEAATVPSVLTGFSLFAMAALSIKAPDRSPAFLMILVGFTVMACGGGLRFYAIGRLGPRFTSDNSIADDAALEQGGVYSWLAHPSEVGLMCLGVGGLCVVQSGWFASLLLVLFALQTWRTHLEERVLFSHYKYGYLAYRRRTWDPLPSMLLIAGGRK